MNHPLTTEDLESYYPHKYSFIGKDGNVVIDASKYQAVRSFSDGLAAVWLANRGWGFIDKSGTLVIDTQYQSVLSFSEGLAAVQLGEEWGFIDREGQLVIEPQYASVNSFSEGIAVVVKSKAEFETDSKISAERHLVQSSLPSVEVKTTVRSRSDLTASYVNNPTSIEVLLIDKGGQTILSKNSSDLDFDIEARPRFSEGLIAFMDPKTRKYGFVDKTGKSVIESKYSKAAPFSEGMARVAMVQGKQEKLGFINHSGRPVIPLRFNTDGDFARNSTDFSEGLASLTENLNPTMTQEEKFAYIDQQGLVVLLTDFFWAGPFREELAAVYDDESEKWGYINKSGKLAIPARYDLAEAFWEGIALVATLTAGR